MGQFGIPPAARQPDNPRESWFPAANSIVDHYHGPESKDPGGAVGQPSKPKGDVSGAGGLIDALNGLAVYAATLLAAGRKRDAAIVQFAYDQVISQKWTVTEAFQYLRDNNLV